MRNMLAAVAAAMLLAACTGQTPTTVGGPSPSPSQPAVPVGLQDYYEQELQWRGCGSGLQCTELVVPRDYTDPAAGDFSLQVVRLPAAGRDRIGALVVNPGGPGASGVDYARAARAVVSDEVRQVYDVVGFDPRGVAGSDPVDCLTDAETDELLAVDPTPDTAAEIRELTAQAAAVGRRCQQRSGEIARWMDTVSTAKDMDVLRSALDEPRLNYLGKSFGTAIGAVYAEQFGDRVGRMVLDGAFPVSLSSREITQGQAVGFETALQRFVADCLDRSDCPLGASTVAGGVTEIGQFLASLETDPIEIRQGEVLTEAVASAALLYYLYFPPDDWARLRQGLAAAYEDDGSVLQTMLAERLQRNQSTGVYASNAQEAFYAVSCLDRPASSLADIEEQAGDWVQLAPTFGRYLAWTDAVCAQWPVEAVSVPRTIAASEAGPILVLSTRYDPATPYAWGVELAGQLERGVLVSNSADGHTAYRNGSPCVDEAVDEYLVSGEVPSQDPRCGY